MINRILAIESSSTICGVSIIESGLVLSLVEESAHRKHAEILPGFIKNALRKSNKIINILMQLRSVLVLAHLPD